MEAKTSRRTTATIKGDSYTGEVSICDGAVGNLELTNKEGSVVSIKGIEGIESLYKSLGKILSLVDKERGIGE